MRRSGLTVVELLMAISLIAVLLALLLPAINIARESSRRTSCANNLRKISLGMLSWAEMHGTFPPAAVWKETSDHPAWDYRNWVVELLPQIDRADLADRWNLEESVGHPDNQAIAETHIRLLACPSDVSVGGNGDLSYALNRGVGYWVTEQGIGCDIITDPLGRPIDLNGDGRQCASVPNESKRTDFGFYHRMTLFFSGRGRLKPETKREIQNHHRMSDVSDGLSNTLMIAENVRTGYDPMQRNSNWASTGVEKTGVYVNSLICRNRSCAPGSVNLKLANSGELAINTGLTRREGEAPWPNSDHRNGVNLAFADGRVQFVSEDIDGEIYFQFYTPQGSRLDGTPLEEGPSLGKL